MSREPATAFIVAAQAPEWALWAREAIRAVTAAAAEALSGAEVAWDFWVLCSEAAAEANVPH